jgi:hypothetical protein
VFRAGVFGLLTLIAAPAFAQSAYVGAAVGMDIARYNHVEFPGSGDLDTSGEAVAFSLKLGTAIGQNWGVELGFTRPSTIEQENSLGYPLPLLTAGAGAVSMPNTGIAIPVFEARTRFERRNTTLETVGWVAQPVSSRVDLVYLGGVAFNRIVEDVSFEFTRRIANIVIPNSTRSVSYDLAPVAGLDARIALTDHVRLVPGLRLQGVGGNSGQGWLLRTSAGLIWQF